VRLADEVHDAVERAYSARKYVTQTADKRIVFRRKFIRTVIEYLFDNAAFDEDRFFTGHDDERRVGIEVFFRLPPEEQIAGPGVFDNVRPVLFAAEKCYDAVFW